MQIIITIQEIYLNYRGIQALKFIYFYCGKLLKEIRPDGLGWDGNYIGRPMPASDYWFVVEYQEDAILKKFKSHFSLKR
jgi:gliding motility-associated-like protein